MPVVQHPLSFSARFMPKYLRWHLFVNKRSCLGKRIGKLRKTLALLLSSSRGLPCIGFFFRDEMMVLAWKSFKAKQQQRKLMKQLYWWCSRVTTARAKAVVHRWWWWRDSGGVRSAIIDVRAKEETNKRQQYWKKHLESSGSTHYKVSTNPLTRSQKKTRVFNPYSVAKFGPKVNPSTSPGGWRL